MLISKCFYVNQRAKYLEEFFQTTNSFIGGSDLRLCKYAQQRLECELNKKRYVRLEVLKTLNESYKCFEMIWISMPTLLLQFLTQSKQILLDLTMPLTTLVFVAQNSDNRETLLYAIFISNSKLPPTKLLLYQQMSHMMWQHISKVFNSSGKLPS